MIGLVDIKKAIVNKLKYIPDINVVANESKSGFDKPAFFISLMPLSDNGDMYVQEQSINVYITYFSSEKTDIANLKMIDTLKKLFVTTLKVNDRVLTLYDKEFDTEDNILKFMFTLRYTEDTPTPIDEEIESYEKMQDLFMNM